MFTHLFTNNILSIVEKKVLSTSIIYSKVDTGTSITFIKTTHISHLKNVEMSQSRIRVLLSNNETLITSDQVKLQFNDCLTNIAEKAHVLPGMTHESLISIGQLCDHNCIAIFSKNDFNILKNNTLVLREKLNKQDGL